MQGKKENEKLLISTETLLPDPAQGKICHFKMLSVSFYLALSGYTHEENTILQYIQV